MRVKSIHKHIPKFQPFKLEFTIETRREAEAFHNLFNYYPICKLLKVETNITGDKVRKALENAIPNLKITNLSEFLDYFFNWS